MGESLMDCTSIQVLRELEPKHAADHISGVAKKKDGAFKVLLQQLSSAHVKQLIRSGDLNKLEQAVLDGQGKKLMGEYSADYKTRTFIKSIPSLMSKISLLHDAVNSGRLEELQSILDEEPEKKKKLVLSKDESGVGLLHKAVYYDLKDIYRWLTEKFPHTVSLRDSEGRTAYHYTPVCKDPQAVQKLLKNAGADPSVLDIYQHTVKYYMDHKEELELPNGQKSPSNKRRNTVSGDSLNFKKSNIRIWIHQRNLTNLQQVVWEGHGSKLLVEHSNNQKIKKFLEAVPHIMGLIKDIHTDVQSGDLESLKKRVSPPIPSVVLSGKDSNGLTALHKAVGLGKQDMAEFIVNEYPNSVNITDNEGRTPLHYAALLKDEGKMMNFLIEHGADESALDKKQKTAAYYKTRHSELDTKLLSIVPECPRVAKESFAQSFDWSMLTSSLAVANGIKNMIKKAETVLENNNTSKKESPETEAQEESNNTDNNNGVTADEIKEDKADKIEETNIDDNKEEKPMDEVEEVANDDDEKMENRENNKENGKDPEVVEQNEPKPPKESGDKENDEQIESADLHAEETNEDHDTNEEPREKEAGTNENTDYHEHNDSANGDANDAKEETRELSPVKSRPASRKIHSSSRPNSGVGNKSRPTSQMIEKDENQNERKETPDNRNEKEITPEPVVEDESVIEGVVNGEDEVEVLNNAGQKQRNHSAEGSNDDIRSLVEAGNMEQLAALVLNGEGERLIGQTSDNPELQSFLENVSVYMSKINRIHEAARNGSLRDLQAALDRRKFAIAKDSISPKGKYYSEINGTGKGTSPLHVAVVFGNTSIVRYLAGRFPETIQVADDDGRTPLHYAAVLPDNGHYYNLLVHLGADTRIQDQFGHTPEFYRKDQSEFSHRSLLKEFGAEENATEEIFTDKVPNDIYSARKDLDDEDMLSVLERCYNVLHGRRNSNVSASSAVTIISVSGTTPILNKHTKKHVFDMVKTRITKLDHNIYDLIWPSVKKLPGDVSFRMALEQDFPLGIVAPDFYAYMVFREFLEPIIKEYNFKDLHQELLDHPKSNFFETNEEGEVTETELDLDPHAKWIISGSLDATRNLEDFELPKSLNHDQLETVERIVTTVLLSNKEVAKALYPLTSEEDIEERGSGTYYTMNEVLEDPSEARVVLASNGLMIPLWNIPDSERLHGKLWPYGRGVFVSNSANLAVWVNVLDHMRIVTCTSIANPGSIGHIYSRVARLMTVLEKNLTFRFDERLGYLSARPTTLGNTLQFSLTVRFPHLIKEPDNLRHLCVVRGLAYNRSAGTADMVRIGNQQCLGITEIQCFDDFTTAVANILQLEKDLAMSNSLHIAAMFLNIFKKKKLNSD
ncbi:hypothetical protein NQ317_000857 [Molorchus minor]|uniref:Arginine kinase n=1 Tax=Molorchus minor TaxID=1323400 RepID=A0ABQ9JUN5_9CUCU|nr:hypothetical protein NQ317_000857 [Molorchus minor]